MAYGWSGLGDAQVVIGPDGQPRVVTSAPINTVTIASSGPAVYQDAAGNVIPLASVPGQSSDLTGWLNENAGTLALTAGGFLALMFFMKGMR